VKKPRLSRELADAAIFSSAVALFQVLVRERPADALKAIDSIDAELEARAVSAGYTVEQVRECRRAAYSRILPLLASWLPAAVGDPGK